MHVFIYVRVYMYMYSVYTILCILKQLLRVYIFHSKNVYMHVAALFPVDPI